MRPLPKVTSSALATVTAAIHSNAPNLQAGKAYTLEQIVGPAIWDLFTPDEHKAIGRHVCDQVRKGALPLKDAGRTSNNRRLYEPI